MTCADNQQERLIKIGWIVGFVDGEGCFSINFIKQNDKKEWIILSAWIDPPIQGSIDVKDHHKTKGSTVSWIVKTIFKMFKITS